MLDHLEHAGYVEATLDYEETAGPAYCRPTEKALQLVAGWPGDMNVDTAARLIAAIDARIEDADSPEERSKWVKLRDGIVGVGRDLFVDVMGNVIKGEL